MVRHSTHSTGFRQKGATLVIALIVLVLIMMIGITAVSTSDTQYKLSGNLQFEDSAMNNAEAAIATAEQWLSTGTNFRNTAFTTGTAPDGDTPGILLTTTSATERSNRLTRPFSGDSWTDAKSLRVGGNTDGNVNQRYYIELLSRNNRLQGSSQVVGGRTSSGCNQVNTYLITGRGASARGATKIVQSYYSVLSC